MKAASPVLRIIVLACLLGVPALLVSCQTKTLSAETGVGRRLPRCPTPTAFTTASN